MNMDENLIRTPIFLCLRRSFSLHFIFPPFELLSLHRLDGEAVALTDMTQDREGAGDKERDVSK